MLSIILTNYHIEWRKSKETYGTFYITHKYNGSVAKLDL